MSPDLSRGVALVALASLAPGAARAVPTPVTAAEARPPAHTLTTEPLAVVFARAFALEFEGRVADGWTLFVQPSVVVGASRLEGVAEDAPDRGFDGYGLGLTVGARFFPFDPGPEGLFLSLFVSGAFATSATDDGTSADGAGFGAGAMIGHTFLLGGSFVLSLGAGAAFAELRPGDGPPRREVQPSIRVAIGAAF